MGKARYGYGWLLKWILAAILIAIGTTMYLNKELVFFVTGVILVIFSLFRIYFLFKTLDKEILRILNLIEVIFGTILGGIMIYVGFRAMNTTWDPESVWSYAYKYGLVFVLAFRAVVFLYSTTFLSEKTEQPKFWFHLALFSMASMIAVLSDFNEGWVAALLLVITVIGAVYLTFDGAIGYKKYREFSLELNQGKSKAKEKSKGKDVEKELPVTDKPSSEKQEDDRPYVN